MKIGRKGRRIDEGRSAGVVAALREVTQRLFLAIVCAVNREHSKQNSADAVGAV
jgi:hypothetical protein